jgi:hypothetical protein
VARRQKLRRPVRRDLTPHLGDPVLLKPVPAQPGEPCCWCDCEVREPEHQPGRMLIFAHDDKACPRCPDPAAVRIRLSVLFHVTDYPVCARHQRPCEAWHVRMFRMGSAS